MLADEKASKREWNKEAKRKRAERRGEGVTVEKASDCTLESRLGLWSSLLLRKLTR